MLQIEHTSHDTYKIQKEYTTTTKISDIIFRKQEAYQREICFSSFNIVTQIHKHCGYSLPTTLQVELSQKRKAEQVANRVSKKPLQGNSHVDYNLKIKIRANTTYSVRKIVMMRFVILILLVPVLLQTLALILANPQMFR